MSVKSLISIVLVLAGMSVSAQKDTVRFHGFANIQGRYQAGNLNQYGGNAIGLLSFGNLKFNTTVSESDLRICQ